MTQAEMNTILDVEVDSKAHRRQFSAKYKLDILKRVSACVAPVLYRNSSQELSKDFGMMRRFGWRDLIGKLAQHWVFSPEFPSVIAP